MNLEEFSGEEVKSSNLEIKSLSVDQLWALYEEVRAMLSERILEEKRGLEVRLARLNGGLGEKTMMTRAAPKGGRRRPNRRKYPPVLPKFQNPANPSETWAGRGQQPRWLVSQLKTGKKMDDFLIGRPKRQSAKRGLS